MPVEKIGAQKKDSVADCINRQFADLVVRGKLDRARIKRDSHQLY